MTSFSDLNSDKALVSRSERLADKRVVTVWRVLLADGFLLDCGFDKIGERRANQMAAVINEGGAHRFSHSCLTTEPVAVPELVA